MNTITNTTYAANNYYYTTNDSASVEAADTGQTSEKEEEHRVLSGDRVTFSSDLAMAKTREALGLRPSGKLKIKDFESVVEGREEIVKTKLAKIMETLGIDPDQQVSLSVDEKYNIRVSEKFPQKSDLEDALNDDEEFTLAFKQLSANQSILDYKSQLQTRQASLMDYLNSDADVNDLLASAAKYEEIKYSNNKMETLMGLSQSKAPYTFVYNPATEEV